MAEPVSWRDYLSAVAFEAYQLMEQAEPLPEGGYHVQEDAMLGLTVALDNLEKFEEGDGEDEQGTDGGEA